jgi:hypothetical protein
MQPIVTSTGMQKKKNEVEEKANKTKLSMNRAWNRDDSLNLSRGHKIARNKGMP